MKRIIDINIEDHKSAIEKITVSSKNFNPENFSIIKCYKNFDEITTIECRKVNLVKIQKTILLNLPNLQCIDLRENKLLKISKNFIVLKNLKTLRLDDNCISFLPSFIGNFDKLETFSISNNIITYLPSSIQFLQSLKTFKISCNQITKLPIEFGQLKSLECLYIDCNYFTEIPTTFGYLKHLSELSFEWLEYLDPPFSKVIKESIGKTIISLIRNSLQEMIKCNILYCDFLTFVEKNSNSKTRRESAEKLEEDSMTKTQKAVSQVSLPGKVQEEKEEKITGMVSTRQVNENSYKYKKIFSAIECNYYGVVKSFLQNSDEYLEVKNSDNKTPLYMSINLGKTDVTHLILSKINTKLLPTPHVYLHKAIRMRDPVLVKQLCDFGFDINASDDQGSTCFHVLFNSFTKSLNKCALIGDFLLQKGAKLNNFNSEHWAPIHIAARRASKECIIWILQQNILLNQAGKETFDLNLKGKNKWTPLHLAINSYRIQESLLLLHSGSDVFAKNSDGKSPRNVTNGNFLLTKLLRNYETQSLLKRFSIQEKNYGKGIYLTTVEDSSHIEDKENFSLIQKKISGTGNIENNDFNSKSHMSSYIKDDISKHSSPLVFSQKLSDVGKTSEKKMLVSPRNRAVLSFPRNFIDNSLNKEKVAPKNEEKRKFYATAAVKNLSNWSDKKTKQHRKEVSNKISLIQSLPSSSNKIHNIPSNYNTTSSMSPMIISPSINSTHGPSPIFTPTSENCNFLAQTKEAEIIASSKEAIKALNNVQFHKDVILNSDSSFAEKYESLMYIKLSSCGDRQKIEQENLIKCIIECLDLESGMNMILFSDICGLIITNQYFNLISFLEIIQNSLQARKSKPLTIQFLEQELTNTIIILKSIKNSLTKTVIYTFQEPILQDLALNVPNQQIVLEKAQKRKCMKKNTTKIMNSNPVSSHTSQGTKTKKRMLQGLNKKKSVDEFNEDEMNEVSWSSSSVQSDSDDNISQKGCRLASQGINETESCIINSSVCIIPSFETNKFQKV